MVSHNQLGDEYRRKQFLYLGQVHLSNEMRMSGIPPLYSCTAHHVELILQVM